MAEPADAARGVATVLCMAGTNGPVLDGSWLPQDQYMVPMIGSHIERVKSGASAPRREIDDGPFRAITNGPA